MSSKNDKRWQKLLSFKNENEKIEHEADMISLRIAVEIEKLIEVNNLTKKQFASKIGTSAAYITQVLRGDKRINMVFLAKVQQGFDITFDFEFQSLSKIDNSKLDKFFEFGKRRNTVDFTEYARKERAFR